MPQVLNNTKLKNRTLWFDGDSSYPPQDIHKVTSDGKIFVDEMNGDVEQYNKLVNESKRICVKKDIRQGALKFNWEIPEEYKTIDIKEYLVNKLDEQNINDPIELKKCVNRVVRELKLYQQHELLDVLRVLIYVINTLNSNSVVWGVGRGSSVSSYVLYLIGVHDVDSVKYELDIEDFLH